CTESVVLDHVDGRQQGARERVDACDVRVKKVGPADALPTKLRIEVESTRCKSSGRQDLVDRQCELVDRVRELVGVPTVLVIAAVDVDAAEAAERDRGRDLVMEAMPREGRVVCLEVEAVLPGEVVAPQESHDRRGVVVVLMFRRLLRLWLDEQRS